PGCDAARLRGRRRRREALLGFVERATLRAEVAVDRTRVARRRREGPRARERERLRLGLREVRLARGELRPRFTAAALLEELVRLAAEAAIEHLCDLDARREIDRELGVLRDRGEEIVELLREDVRERARARDEVVATVRLGGDRGHELLVEVDVDADRRNRH